jgi:peptide/nickel transport system permease protein
MMPVILWTDALFFVLLISGFSFAVYASRHAHLRAPWRQVARNPLAMSACTVLMCYVLIGLLDSLHFHPALPTSALSENDPALAHHSTKILSVLDVWLHSLRERQETTFSAPLATHSFVLETMTQADGRVIRHYPRLQYGGAHLHDPAREHGLNLAILATQGAIMGIVLWFLLAAMMTWIFALRHHCGVQTMWHQIWRGTTSIPWWAILMTLAILFVLFGIVATLSTQYHVLGTDKVGEDVLYQSLKSVRTGLMIGTLTTLVMLPAAIILGLAAGYFRGIVDDLVQYLYITLSSIPSVLLIAAAILLLQVYMTNHAESFTSLAQRADLRLLFLCLILGMTSWTGVCRLLRGETLKLRATPYVQAAQTLGVGHSRILARHIFPNVLHIAMIALVLDFSGLVLAEAVLSYVNIGVDPTMYSWGNMINGARLELAREPIVWWSLLAAFLGMFLLVLAANLVADAVRDAFDPRLAANQ